MFESPLRYEHEDLPVTMPSHLGSEDRRSVFDKFADSVSKWTSRAWFFAACVLLVLIWAPLFLVLPSIDTWQLFINTPTTVVTFLLVALLQNTGARSDSAMHTKLNAIAEGVADLLDQADGGEAHELRQAVGLEQREPSS